MSCPCIQAVADYKRVFQRILDQRPSGTRQYLAQALGKNRSFISQISNPGYKTPIPPRHVPVIFEICHFSTTDKDAFLHSYRQAHPGRMDMTPPVSRTRTLVITVPDLASRDHNNQLEKLIREFSVTAARQLSQPDK